MKSISWIWKSICLVLCANKSENNHSTEGERGESEKNILLINKRTAKSTKSIWSPRFSNNKQKQTPQITFGWECLLLLLFLLLLLLLLLRFTHLVPAASGDDDGNGGCCCSVSLLIRSKQLRGHITNMAKKASKKSETRIIMTTILATIMNKSC